MTTCAPSRSVVKMWLFSRHAFVLRADLYFNTTIKKTLRSPLFKKWHQSVFIQWVCSLVSRKQRWAVTRYIYSITSIRVTFWINCTCQSTFNSTYFLLLFCYIASDYAHYFNLYSSLLAQPICFGLLIDSNSPIIWKQAVTWLHTDGCFPVSALLCSIDSFFLYLFHRLRAYLWSMRPS